MQRSTTQSYRLLRTIGEGGLGRVWLAKDERLNRNVAIKELRPDRTGDAALQSRFLREARIHARLQHPNIAPFFHFGKDNADRLFIVMHLIGGSTLETRVRALGLVTPDWNTHRLELRQLLEVFLKACDAVAFAHSRGIIHRDLKPANVMTGEFGEVFVLDWGLAKELESTDESLAYSPGNVDAATAPADDAFDVTKAGNVLGSLPYMAPEQAGSRLGEIGRSADVFGLGGILYFILTGQPPHPFVAGDVRDFVFKIENEKPISACVRNATIPRPLAAIAAKATAMRPADRYASATELSADIRRWLDDEPVLAFAEPMRLRIARWALQHKLGMSAFALSVFTAVLIIVVTQFHRWASGESLISQQFLESRREVENAAVDLRHDTQRTATFLTFAAKLPSIRALFEEGRTPAESDITRSAAGQVLETFVQLQPPVLRAAVIHRDGRSLAYFRSVEKGGRTLVADGPMMWAAGDIIKSAGAVRVGQVAAWPPSKSGAISTAENPTIIVAAPIRGEADDDILGALVIETRFSVMGLHDPSTRTKTDDDGPEDWYYFGGKGRLLYYSINSGATLPADSEVPSLEQVFPELTSLLHAEELPATVEITRAEPRSTIVAHRYQIEEFYPVGTPIIVNARPVSTIAGLSSERVGYLAAAALMIVALSCALAVVIAWTLVRIVRSA